jgi:hypothetical protein
MKCIALCEVPPMEFEANGRKYKYRYFLADGIYPRWSTFMKTVVKPKCKRKLDFHSGK